MNLFVDVTEEIHVGQFSCRLVLEHRVLHKNRLNWGQERTRKSTEFLPHKSSKRIEEMRGEYLRQVHAVSRSLFAGTAAGNFRGPDQAGT